MSEWISCRNQLPMKRKWVLVKFYDGVFDVKRVGIFDKQWKFKSGMKRYINDSDEWKEKQDEP